MAGNSVPLQNTKQRAIALLQGNRLADACGLFEQICRIDGNDVESWIFLVKINAQLGRPDQVERCCREIIRIQPRSHDAHYHLGCALLFQGRRAEATPAFRRAAELKPDHAPTQMQLGHLSPTPEQALRHYQQAAGTAPSFAEAHAAAGAALVSCGQVEEGVSRLRQALRLNPTLHRTHSDLLFALNYRSAYDASAIFSEHARWGELHGLPSLPSHANTPDPGRRLRIGYVSPDLREHSVAYFFEPLLGAHSTSEFETFCYAEVAQPDATTRRIQSLSQHWMFTCDLSDAALAERIRADRIDILVDLAGHSANNRLLTFFAKPAPVQITWLGYPNTTGLKAMDYRFTDAWSDPPGDCDRCHTEQLIRLPNGFLCYLPPSIAPEVSPPPAQINGHITFGSYNNLPKTGPEVVALWARILHAVPGARLILKNYSLEDPATRERYHQLFGAHGISAERLVLRGRHDSVAEHLGSYSEIDIALDTFPYNGTTTTCEALWMGVPVVALAGDRHAARVGVSLLNNLGLPGLIADSADAYVRIAARLASEPAELAQLRTSLRSRMSGSPLCDARSFARDMESGYRALWKNWCEARQASQNGDATPAVC